MGDLEEIITKLNARLDVYKNNTLTDDVELGAEYDGQVEAMEEAIFIVSTFLTK